MRRPKTRTTSRRLGAVGKLSLRWSRPPWSPPKLALRTRTGTSRSASGRRPRCCCAVPIRGAITIDRDLRGYEGQPAELRLTACDDTSDYRDSSVTLAFHTASLMTQRGNVAAGPPARIQLLNDDPVPVVEFGSRVLRIDEGKSQTVAIVADGELAGAVMQVAVEAAGDALISMQQRDRPLDENPDGSACRRAQRQRDGRADGPR